MSDVLAIHAYVINLDNATKRWLNVETIFSETQIAFSRVPAIEGKTLSLQPAEYSEKWYRFLHGRETNPPEVGCYLSHLNALHRFLATDAELALICEDDLKFEADLTTLLTRVLSLRRFWNILRLSGLSHARPVRVRNVHEQYSLCVNFGRIKGSGAYVIDRKAARVFTRRLLPMKLPYDHAIDREWFYGLTAASISPFPVIQRQKKFGSAIQTYAQPKLSSVRRWFTTYPYQAFNEATRWICRGALYLRTKWRKL